MPDEKQRNRLQEHWLSKKTFHQTSLCQTKVKEESAQTELMFYKLSHPI